MSYINEDFMLSGKTARELYHEHAEKMPIIDYHCHLVPQEIAENKQFRDITELWLGADHYKWRAMRGNGVPEEYITGNKSSWEKFEKWAGTVQYAMRNPLYHWTHLELKRVFGIDTVLSPATARDIFEECNAKLATPEYRGQALIRKFNVKALCTTDDPADDLKWHRMILDNPFGTKVLPAWRPDKAMGIEKGEGFRAYILKLGEAAGMEIRTYADLMEALKKRHDFFESMGCKVSDHGMDTFYAEDYTAAEIETIFAKAMSGKALYETEVDKYRSAFMYDVAVMDAESGWAQQFHIGPSRNNNSRMFKILGPDAGFDAILDHKVAEAGAKFLDRLDSAGKLAKTILYCLNPKDNAVMTVMAYTFNDGSCPGKMQFGAGWWFMDQEFGMRKQIDDLSAMGLLSRFVGMLTDSRSFVSYPRHEYFRRILCDVIGADVDSGRLPACEMERIGEMIEDISYNNAASYFGI